MVKFAKKDAVRRANDELCAALPTEPVTQTSSSVSPVQESREDVATLERALNVSTILPTLAYKEGKFILDKESARRPLFAQIFTAAFLHIDQATGVRAWKVDKDIINIIGPAIVKVHAEFATYETETGEQSGVTIIPTQDLATRDFTLTDTSERRAIASLHTLFFHLGDTQDPVPNLSEPQQTEKAKFIFALGHITFRAFLRHNARLNITIPTLERQVYEDYRRDTMADNENLFIVTAEVAAARAQAAAEEALAAAERARKKREKKKAWKVRQKAKKNEEGNDETAGGDSEIEEDNEQENNETTEGEAKVKDETSAEDATANTNNAGTTTTVTVTGVAGVETALAPLRTAAAAGNLPNGTPSHMNFITQIPPTASSNSGNTTTSGTARNNPTGTAATGNNSDNATASSDNLAGTGTARINNLGAATSRMNLTDTATASNNSGNPATSRTSRRLPTRDSITDEHIPESGYTGIFSTEAAANANTYINGADRPRRRRRDLRLPRDTTARDATRDRIAARERITARMAEDATSLLERHAAVGQDHHHECADCAEHQSHTEHHTESDENHHAAADHHQEPLAPATYRITQPNNAADAGTPASDSAAESASESAFDPTNLSHVDPTAAMHMATQALLNHGASIPVGLSQMLTGIPARSARPAAARAPRPADAARAQQALYDEINGLLDANAHLPPAERVAVWTRARQQMLAGQTVAAAGGRQHLRPTAPAGRFDIGGMPGWLGELEAMQIAGLRRGVGGGRGGGAKKGKKAKEGAEKKEK